jgi:hypothetical protein
MIAPIIYIAHPLTGEYLGTGYADPDPLDADNWLVPGHAYRDAPPPMVPGEAAVWTGRGWSLRPDRRGQVYRTATGEAVMHDQLGELPEGLTTEPRPTQDYRWDSTGWVLDVNLKAANRLVLTTGLCQQIDSAADTARRAVAGDPLRAVEYERSAAEAQAFKSAGYPANSVPRTVSAWAIGGRTALQAADSILLEAAQFNEALYQIREARLGAKEMVRQAMANGDVDQAQDIAAETIAAIESAISGIGNARG